MSTLASEEDYLASISKPSSNDDDDAEPNLFEIVSWADVLIPKVASYLSLKDLFNLRCVSLDVKRFAESALGKRKEIHLSGNNSMHIDLAFAVLRDCCYQLRVLQLAKCFWLTDDLILPILTNNTHLRVVNLNECVNITALGLHPVIIKCKDLRVLKLSKCQWLTTGAVDALTLHQNNLEEFDISNCVGIGERCLFIFFRKLNKLTILSLANIPSVTDPVLIQISNYCRALEHINLVGCTAISDYGINAISTNCTGLRWLFIARCPQITEQILMPLRKRINIDRPKRLDFDHHDFYPSDYLIYYALTTNCKSLQSIMVKNCPSVTERVLAPLRGRIHIDRPNQSYNLPALVNRLYLQV